MHEQNEDNFQKWFRVFKKGWNVRVVENEHLMKICFLEFLSTVNKVRYIYGGQYKNVNLSSFKIQQSGTGKGVGDKFVADALRHMGYKICKINSFTEAAMIGSVTVDNTGKAHIIKGAMGEYDFIWIDEARNLLVPNQWGHGLLEVINGYLDDGYIFKRLAKGEIKYWSNCNFASGTFFFSKLKPTVLATGLFQRCLFSYKNYSNKEIMKISKLYDGLASKSYITDLQPVFEELKSMRDKLNFEKYNIRKGSGHPNYVIKMTPSASLRFGKEIDRFFKDEVLDQVSDERLKSILTSFLIRSKELGHQVMCLKAVWNEKDTIDESCVYAGITMVKDHLRYILEFVGDIFETTKFDTEDLNKEELKRKKIQITKNIIIDVLKKNPGKTKGEFRIFVQNNRDKFAIGEIRVLAILNKMIRDGSIAVQQGASPAEKILFAITEKKL